MATPSANGTNGHVGRVVQIIDRSSTWNYRKVSAADLPACGLLPKVIDVPDPINVIAEVQQHLGEGPCARVIAATTHGRGMKATDRADRSQCRLAKHARPRHDVIGDPVEQLGPISA